jgi:hypothetical protein
MSADPRPYFPNSFRDLTPELARVAVFIVAIGRGPEIDYRKAEEKTVAGCEGGACAIGLATPATAAGGPTVLTASAIAAGGPTVLTASAIAERRASNRLRLPMTDTFALAGDPRTTAIRGLSNG